MSVLLGVALFFAVGWALTLNNDLQSVARELSRISKERTEILISIDAKIEKLTGELAASRELSAKYALQLQQAWQQISELEQRLG